MNKSNNLIAVEPVILVFNFLHFSAVDQPNGSVPGDREHFFERAGELSHSESKCECVLPLITVRCK